MAAILCPWCQSEIPVEEGQGPDKFCPVCDNEIDGYRTLRIGIDEEDEEDEEDGDSVGLVRAEDEEDLSWMQDDELQEKDEALIQFEEAVEELLDEQEVVPNARNAGSTCWRRGSKS
ncbi:hypothetical protein [Cohnella faecalis]|uniref:Uncharacterized protein n=1 Tax=Cohnella faecalis TaxID=2315694 RepID=A0A398CE62_9BACL|nr:hypothetical protein [Cohnella faecalis]RIE00993.1 hypothetical protein D3H35_25270 [Cohnella faecalis]